MLLRSSSICFIISDKWGQKHTEGLATSMNREELFARADQQSLTPLLELSDHLTLQHGRIRGIDRLDVPLDEYGIPKRTEFVKMALGTIATDHY